jgi:hypothetical protein
MRFELACQAQTMHFADCFVTVVPDYRAQGGARSFSTRTISRGVLNPSFCVANCPCVPPIPLEEVVARQQPQLKKSLRALFDDVKDRLRFATHFQAAPQDDDGTGCWIVTLGVPQLSGRSSPQEWSIDLAALRNNHARRRHTR